MDAFLPTRFSNSATNLDYVRSEDFKSLHFWLSVRLFWRNSRINAYFQSKSRWTETGRETYNQGDKLIPFEVIAEMKGKDYARLGVLSSSSQLRGIWRYLNQHLRFISVTIVTHRKMVLGSCIWQRHLVRMDFRTFGAELSAGRLFVKRWKRRRTCLVVDKQGKFLPVSWRNTWC